jgi:hypothetical protein
VLLIRCCLGRLRRCLLQLQPPPHCRRATCAATGLAGRVADPSDGDLSGPAAHALTGSVNSCCRTDLTRVCNFLSHSQRTRLTCNRRPFGLLIEASFHTPHEFRPTLLLSDTAVLRSRAILDSKADAWQKPLARIAFSRKTQCGVPGLQGCPCQRWKLRPLRCALPPWCPAARGPPQVCPAATHAHAHTWPGAPSARKQPHLKHADVFETTPISLKIPQPGKGKSLVPFCRLHTHRIWCTYTSSELGTMSNHQKFAG